MLLPTMTRRSKWRRKGRDNELLKAGEGGVAMGGGERGRRQDGREGTREAVGFGGDWRGVDKIWAEVAGVDVCYVYQFN